MPLTAGRVCPLAYRYRSSAVRAAAVHAARSAYVVGGLYGNTEALDAVLGLADAEQQATGQRPLLVFNGDWNWFNTGHAELLHVNRVIREECEMGRAVATAGNIEMELGAAQASLDRGAASAAPADAGCGCAYPEYVDGGVVARSNQLMERLQRQLCRGDGGEREMAEVGRWLVGLPLFTRLEVGGQRVAVLHGDAQSLAGWSFAAEAMVPPDAALLRALGVWPPADKDGDWEAVQSEVAAGGGEVVGSRGGWKPTPHTEVAEAFEALAADVIACTHTCLPFAQQFRWTRPAGGAGGGGTASVGAARRGVLANNGSAGMPNFSGGGGAGPDHAHRHRAVLPCAAAAPPVRRDAEVPRERRPPPPETRRGGGGGDCLSRRRRGAALRPRALGGCVPARARPWKPRLRLVLGTHPRWARHVERGTGGPHQSTTRVNAHVRVSHDDTLI